MRPVDADAKAFLTATGITDGTIETAIERLVRDLKLAGIWTAMKAIYPMVGGTAARCKYNLKDPRDLDAAYRLTFFNAPTIDANGVKWNGTTQYALTHFVPSTGLSTRRAHLSYYNIDPINNPIMDMGCRSSADNSQYAIGAGGTLNLVGHMRGFISTASADQNGAVGNVPTGQTVSTGFYIATRNSDTTVDALKNGVHLASSSSNVVATANTTPMALGGLSVNAAGAVAFFARTKCGFASIGEPLTVIQAQSFSTIVNDFMTRMSRNTY